MSVFNRLLVTTLPLVPKPIVRRVASRYPHNAVASERGFEGDVQSQRQGVAVLDCRRSRSAYAALTVLDGSRTSVQQQAPGEWPSRIACIVNQQQRIGGCYVSQIASLSSVNEVVHQQVHDTEVASSLAIGAF